MDRGQLAGFVLFSIFVYIHAFSSYTHNVKFLHNGDLMPVAGHSRHHMFGWVSNFTGAQKLHVAVGANNTQST
jgi:hypothetical protein